MDATPTDKNDVDGIYPTPIRIPLVKSGGIALTDCEKKQAEQAFAKLFEDSTHSRPFVEQLNEIADWLSDFDKEALDKPHKSDIIYALRHVKADPKAAKPSVTILDQLNALKVTIDDPTIFANVERLARNSLRLGELVERIFARQFNETTKKGQRQEQNAMNATNGRIAQASAKKEEDRREAEKAMNWARDAFPHLSEQDYLTGIQEHAAAHLGVSVRTLQRRLRPD